jgi:hypothetical protein
MEVIESFLEDYCISTDRQKSDIISTHNFLTNESEWANGIQLSTVKL